MTNNNHMQVFELLPWYANRTLSPAEAGFVEEHLPNCAECRTELARCQAIGNQAKVMDQDAWRPSSAHFKSILANIDALEAGPAKAAKVGFLSAISGWLTATPSGARWALGVQAALVAVLGAALLFKNASGPEPYQTLDDGKQVTAVVNGNLLRIVFADDITEKDMRALLQEVRGSIVQGPSSTGVYSVAIAGRSEQAVTALKINPKIKFVQAVSTGGQ